MSVVSLVASENNPVTKQDVYDQLKKLDLAIPESEITDFTAILAAVHDSAEKIDALPDYLPPTNLDRFPRKNVTKIYGTDDLGAWVYKFDIEDQNPNSGPLKGKTVSIKDNIGVAGIPQVNGTDTWDPWIPKADATVVRRVLENGGHIVGTANCEQLCLFTGSHTSCLGDVHNPHAPGHTTGGSSSGSAASVASGQVDMSIGCDQGGSIRIPSALSGLVGLKPTFGLVPYTGIVTHEFTFDHCGPMTRTVEDNVLLLEAIAGVDGFDDRQMGAPNKLSVSYKTPRKLKLGVLKEAFEVPTLDPKMKNRIFEAIEVWKKLGYEVEEVSVPLHTLGPELWTIIERFSGFQGRLGKAGGRRVYMMREYYENAELNQRFFDKAPPNVKNSVINSLYLSEKFPNVYYKATNLIHKLSDDYNSALNSVDLLVLPTVPFTAPKLGPRQGSPIEQIKPSFGLNTNTCVFNATGHPALSLPIGRLEVSGEPGLKLPAAVQLVGKFFDESTIYTAAYAYEQAHDWHSS